MTTDAPERFFPTRDERTVLDFVLQDFPYPLALTYHRLQLEMDRQEPVAATWQLRDAFEVLIKVSATLSIADALASPTDGVVIGDLAGTLLTPQGLSMGHWHRLLEASLDPLKPFVRDGTLDASGRVLPDLFGAFYQETGRLQRTETNQSISGDADSFIPWRNRVFGHGVFSEDRSWYAAETTRMLESLHAFYTALKPIFDAWQLISQNPDGSTTAWLGAGSPELSPVHEHEPKGESLPMALASRQPGISRQLPLSPLLSIHQCAVCGEPAVFFFDRQNKAKTILLEYARGHHHSQPGWAEIARLQSLVPPAYAWERGTYDSHEIVATDEIVFRDFESTFHRPAYLLDRIWDTVDERSRGYTHIVGPAGTGKTYLIRGLEAEAARHDAVVLPYFIRPGALTPARTFLNELHLLASNHERLRARTDAPQQLVTSVAELQDQFVAYLQALMDANRLETLVLAIDAIDELPEPEPGTVSIAALLPAPSHLPDGCTIVLTSRDAYRSGIRKDIGRLATVPGDGYVRINLSPESEDNTAVIRSWLADTLPTNLRNDETIAAIVDKSNGVFLYASHLALALAAGAFDDVETMPDASDFYPAYLARIRERVGDESYDQAYLQPLLLFVAAFQPVTKDQLIAWGVPADRLETALYDLHDFLDQQRIPGFHETPSDNPAPRYRLAHEDFARYVQSDPGLSERLRDAHATIGQRALNAFGGRWDMADPTDDGDLYDLVHIRQHLGAAGLLIEVEALLRDERYADACSHTGHDAADRNKYLIAIAAYDEAIAIRRDLVDGGRADLANDLAAAIMNRGNALRNLGRLPEAIAAYDEAIAIRRELVDGGRSDLANDLAAAIMNRGNALADLGRLPEAIAAYDEAIAIRRELVASGRSDLANDLAMAIMNRAVALEQHKRVDQALADYDEAIGWYATSVERGEAHHLPSLLRAVRYRAMTFGDLERWKEMAQDIDSFLNAVQPMLETQDRPEALMTEIVAAIDMVNRLAPEYQEEVLRHLGPWEMQMRRWLDQRQQGTQR